LSDDPLARSTAPIHQPRKAKVRPVQAHDPWAVPEEEEAVEEQPKPVVAEGEVVEPYLLGGEEKTQYPEMHFLEGKARSSREEKAERRARKRRQARQYRPAAVGEGIGLLFRGLATFPVQGKNPSALVALSIGFFVLGGAIYVLIEMLR
jgi:hypothetical protein